MILVRHVIDTEHAAYGIFISRQPRWFSHGFLVSRPSGPTARGLIKRNHQPLTTSSREAWQTYLLLPICILRLFANVVALNRFEHFQSFHWLSAANEETGYTFIRFFLQDFASFCKTRMHPCLKRSGPTQCMDSMDMVLHQGIQLWISQFGSLPQTYKNRSEDWRGTFFVPQVPMEC
jgi:hypothetical protein